MGRIALAVAVVGRDAREERKPGEHAGPVAVCRSPADSFYVILSGEGIVRGKPAARTLAAGDYFGEMGLLGGGKRSATVVATAELHVMRLPRRTFLELLEKNGVALQIMSELGARARRLEQPPAASG